MLLQQNDRQQPERPQELTGQLVSAHTGETDRACLKQTRRGKQYLRLSCDCHTHAVALACAHTGLKIISSAQTDEEGSQQCLTHLGDFKVFGGIVILPAIKWP